MWFFSAMNNYTATKSLGLIVVKLADMLLLDEKDPGTRRSTKIPDNGRFCDLLRSDPADVVIEFLDKNDFDLICQGHQKLVSLFLVYEAHLGYIIEDVHPNGSIKKIKSSVYSNSPNILIALLYFPVYNFLSSKIHFDWFPNPVVLKVMSHTQQGEMSLFANRFRRLREAARGHLSRLQGIWSPCSDQVAVELNTHSCCMCGRTHSCCKAADSVGTSPEPTTKKPVRCNNLE
ncbi:hypothetical protein HID58_086105 [Brassica napus]|uniref:Uncharacterized protein n=2 Tax=Brassica TaxID=3705 RepID=A0ABQ7XPJ6_BRANA|nr:hypothetical protein HID58_086105 [Brassica napus]